MPVAPGTAGSLFGALLFLALVWSFRLVGLGPLALMAPAAGASSLSIPATLSPFISPFTSLFASPFASPFASLFASPLVGAAVMGSAYGLVVLLLFGLGVWASGRAEIDFGRHDDGRIVIDEVVGQLVTLSPLLFVAVGSDLFVFVGWVVTGFVLFRLFDVWKPGAIGWAERRFDGGLGVMADDVMAGIHGGVGLLFLMWTGWMGTEGLMTEWLMTEWPRGVNA